MTFRVTLARSYAQMAATRRRLAQLGEEANFLRSSDFTRIAQISEESEGFAKGIPPSPPIFAAPFSRPFALGPERRNLSAIVRFGSSHLRGLNLLGPSLMACVTLPRDIPIRLNALSDTIDSPGANDSTVRRHTLPSTLRLM